MRHRLSHVQIKNFRCAQDLSFDLLDYTPIVGKNNAGKSTVLSSVRWLLKGGALTDRDYGNPQDAIWVAGIIDGIAPALLEALNDEHRKRIEAYCSSGRLAIRRSIGAVGGAAKQFDVASLADDAELTQADWVKNPTGIEAAIKALFPEPILIAAMEDAAEDVGSNKSSTTIGKLIAQLVTPVRDGHGDDIAQALELIRTRMGAAGEGRAPELADADAGMNGQLATLFPGLTVKLHVEPPSVADLLKVGTVRVFEEGNETGREIGALGHGAQRAVQIALIQYLAERLRDAGATSDARVLLLIEEPELYLHPQAVVRVREALRHLSAGRFQVVISTHSPLMLELDDLPAAVLLSRAPGQPAKVKPSLRAGLREVVADAPSQSRTLMEMSNAQHILFSDRILLAEGPTETRVLPFVFSRVVGHPIDADRIGLVGPGGGAGQLLKCLKVLRAIGVSVRALADLDYALRTAPSNGLIPEKHLSLEALRAVASRLAPLHGFQLAPDGFPQSGGKVGVPEAIELIAADPEAHTPILDLHNTLREHDIWLWRKGAIEAHFGIDGKKEASRSAFLNRLVIEKPEAVIKDLEGVKEFFGWLVA
jgi:putative ATP-dependent endonuclease of OLD family